MAIMDYGCKPTQSVHHLVARTVGSAACDLSLPVNGRRHRHAAQSGPFSLGFKVCQLLGVGNDMSVPKDFR